MKNSPLSNHFTLNKEESFRITHKNSFDSRQDIRRSLMRHLGPQKTRPPFLGLKSDFNFENMNGIENLRKLSENEMLVNATHTHNALAQAHSYKFAPSFARQSF